ncbi:MAG: PorV/PorQ family protein [Candidatus Latescibacteria bacterium]|jgi:hypothetical protein|nr:PorV/PorQ family protein [Candidatus Latescibacterota bacterium]
MRWCAATLVVTVLGVVSGLPGGVSAQSNTGDHLPTDPPLTTDKVGQAGMTFLQVQVNSRAAGMSGAQTSSGGGAATVFTNPALIPLFSGDADAYAAQVSWFADISISAVSAVFRLPFASNVVVGASLLTTNYGDIHYTELALDDPSLAFRDLGLVDVNEFAAGVAVGAEITDRFSLGVSARLVSQELWGNRTFMIVSTDPASDSLLNLPFTDSKRRKGLTDSTGATTADPWTFDFGTRYETGFESLVLSMSIRNFARATFHEDKPGELGLPIELRIGVAADVLDFMGDVGDGPNSLLLAVEGIHPRDHPEKLAMGLEADLMGHFQLRGGYTFNEDVIGFSAGVGVRQRIGPSMVGVDYAYTDVGSILGATHRWGLTFGF